MTLDMAKVLAAAKAMQDDLDSVGLPPEESTPSRSHSVLDIALVRGTRGYIEKVAHQINKTYDDACFDACAVMLRRLVETLIIEAFEANGIDDHIQRPSGDFMQLRDLIDKALAEKTWNLGRNIMQALPRLKDIGDKSAHDRRFNAMRHDIDKVKDDLRVVLQALVYLAKLK